MRRCTIIGCNRAGSHGDPKAPTLRFCTEHRDPDHHVLLIADAPPPPGKRSPWWFGRAEDET